jgi:hypothetical protein
MAEYALPIVLTFVGFVTLAAILLVPVYRFLNREERKSRDWTEEALAARRMREGPPGDGAPGAAPRPVDADEPDA